eukprot:1335154-Amorphochlora_amoeboformis.AAC.2
MSLIPLPNNPPLITRNPSVPNASPPPELLSSSQHPHDVVIDAESKSLSVDLPGREDSVPDRDPRIPLDGKEKPIVLTHPPDDGTASSAKDVSLADDGPLPATEGVVLRESAVDVGRSAKSSPSPPIVGERLELKKGKPTPPDSPLQMTLRIP